MKLVCINDSNRPNEIPKSHWVKKDEIYTVLHVAKLHAQGGIFGVQIEEIDLTPFAPITYFAADRFKPVMFSPDKEDHKEEILEAELT
jgi:hypothetical protein